MLQKPDLTMTLKQKFYNWGIFFTMCTNCESYLLHVHNPLFVFKVDVTFNLHLHYFYTVK